MRIDHIGWVTSNAEQFESFWCDVLGFKLVKEALFPAWKVALLFKSDCDVKVKRYHHPDMTPDIEIHVFPDKEIMPASIHFQRQGINHICLETGKYGSRQSFLDGLPDTVIQHTCRDPGGWENVFLQDFERNWIEIREDFSK